MGRKKNKLAKQVSSFEDEPASRPAIVTTTDAALQRPLTEDEKFERDLELALKLSAQEASTQQKVLQEYDLQMKVMQASGQQLPDELASKKGPLKPEPPKPPRPGANGVVVVSNAKPVAPAAAVAAAAVNGKPPPPSSGAATKAAPPAPSSSSASSAPAQSSLKTRKKTQVDLEEQRLEQEQNQRRREVKLFDFLPKGAAAAADGSVAASPPVPSTSPSPSGSWSHIANKNVPASSPSSPLGPPPVSSSSAPKAAAPMPAAAARSPAKPGPGVPPVAGVWAAPPTAGAGAGPAASNGVSAGVAAKSVSPDYTKPPEHVASDTLQPNAAAAAFGPGRPSVAAGLQTPMPTAASASSFSGQPTGGVASSRTSVMPAFAGTAFPLGAEAERRFSDSASSEDSVEAASLFSDTSSTSSNSSSVLPAAAAAAAAAAVGPGPGPAVSPAPSVVTQGSEYTLFSSPANWMGLAHSAAAGSGDGQQPAANGFYSPFGGGGFGGLPGWSSSPVKNQSKFDFAQDADSTVPDDSPADLYGGGGGLFDRAPFQTYAQPPTAFGFPAAAPRPPQAPMQFQPQQVHMAPAATKMPYKPTLVSHGFQPPQQASYLQHQPPLQQQQAMPVYGSHHQPQPQQFAQQNFRPHVLQRPAGLSQPANRPTQSDDDENNELAAKLLSFVT